MVNLAGFCGGDPTDCANRSIPPNAQVAADLVAQGPYAYAVSQLRQATANFLYRVAARIGTKLACPLIVPVAEATAVSVAAQYLPAELAIPGFGIVLGISTEVIAAVIGREVGTEVRLSLCGY